MSTQKQNIPIEIFRTVVAILETGSLTKAALKLGLSQPAVSAQIKRIEAIVGGAIFSKTANGSLPTDLGKIVVAQARRILSANEQTLALGGRSQGPDVLRVGLSSLLVRSFMEGRSARSMSNVQVMCDTSSEIAKAILRGQIDIACIYQTEGVEDDLATLVVNEFEDQLVWIRASDFVLSPGAPIPIITWSCDDWMTSTLTQKGLVYRIAFNGSDFDAKKSAVEAGLGISALPETLIPPSLVQAKEYYLPELPKIKGLLCMRPGIVSEKLADIKEHLELTFCGGTEVGVSAPDFRGNLIRAARGPK